MCNSLTRIFFSFSGHFPSETETERKPDVQNEAAESDKGKVVPPKVHSCKPEQQIITQPIEKRSFCCGQSHFLQTHTQKKKRETQT